MNRTEKIDPRQQRRLLNLLLDDGPRRLTLDELQARLGGSEDVARLVETLVADDLVVREGDEVAPTPAAIRFHELIPTMRTLDV